MSIYVDPSNQYYFQSEIFNIIYIYDKLFIVALAGFLPLEQYFSTIFNLCPFFAKHENFMPSYFKVVWNFKPNIFPKKKN